MDGFWIKNYKLLITAALLVMGLIFFLFAAPKLPLWSYSYSYDPSEAEFTDITAGDQYEVSFTEPFDRINKIELFWDFDRSVQGHVIVPFDADLEFIDSNGNVVLSKHMTSIYDTGLGGGYTEIDRQEVYTLRLTVNSVDALEGSALPQIKTDGQTLSFSIYGCHSGAPNKGLFPVIYAIFALIILLYVYSMDKDSKELKKISERLLFWGISLFSILFLGQVLDLEMIARSAFKIIESVKAGNFLNYYDYSYTSALEPGVDFIHLGYNYDFFLMLPVTIVLFPLSFFMTSDMPYWQGYNAVSVFLSLCVLGLILLCAKLIGKICDTCGMPEGYRETVKKFFLFSPVILCASVTFGQIDMLYITVILAALIFYYKGDFRKFTLLMSVASAMKLFPLMIFIPLILLVKKKPLELILHGAGVLVCPLLTLILFKHGAGYTAIMNIVEAEYSFSEMLFEQNIGGRIALFPLVYAFICIWAYVHDASFTSKSSMLKTSMLLIFASYANFTVFSSWHFQWLIPLSLSLAFLIPFYSKKRGVLLIGAAAEVLLLLYVMADDRISVYETNFLFPVLFDYEYHGLFISEFFSNINEHIYTLIVSLTSACIAALSYIFFKGEKDTETYVTSCEEHTACLRVTALYAAAVLFVWCYCYVG